MKQFIVRYYRTSQDLDNGRVSQRKFRAASFAQALDKAERAGIDPTIQVVDVVEVN